MVNQNIGVFRGTTLIQQYGSIGGARSVFVPTKGLKNQLVYPLLGGQIKNPFKGVPAKIFAGNLMEFRTNPNGVSPEVYILKTYKVAKETSTLNTVTIERDGYSHVPFVGDVIGKAPETIGGTITELTVTAVKPTVGEKNAPVWELTLSTTATFAKGDVLVEGDGEGNMLVKEINAFADSDADFLYEPATGDEDFDGARYMYTPAIGGAIIFVSKMQALPKCVLDKNVSRFNGWYQLPSIG